MNFHPDFRPSVPEGDHLWILFSSGETDILVEEGSGSPLLHRHSMGPLQRSFVIGTSEDGLICCGEPEEGASPPRGWEWTSFWQSYRAMDSSLHFAVSRAKQLLNWDRSHRFCGVCGTETQGKSQEPVRTCPSCGETSYPRLSPAVIVRITRGEQIMLAHNKNFPEGLYSHIAGFVEAGESLKEAVRREVREEVGLEVENIRYFGSQPWPMPHSLMIAFTAECPQGDPEPDGEEIVDARWFSREDMPGFPSSQSIAMSMIRDYLGELSPAEAGQKL